MKEKMINLIKKELSSSNPINTNNLQSKLCEITGRNIKCLKENDQLSIQISVPWLGKGIAKKMLNANDIQELLNSSNLSCGFQCMENSKGLLININNSPKKDLNKISIEIV